MRVTSPVTPPSTPRIGKAEWSGRTAYFGGRPRVVLKGEGGMDEWVAAGCIFAQAHM